MRNASLHLEPGQSAVFGYGSLLSIRSLERTLGRAYDGPFLQVELPGWRRSWDAAMPNKKFYAELNGRQTYPETILYLNVVEDPDSILNGILFIVSASELESFDERESIYDRLDVTDQLSIPVSGGRAYVYVCRPEHTLREASSPAYGAVRATYIDIVETGLRELGDSFRAGYERSSDAIPLHLIIQDRS
jgi:gamma-glutamylcyclotransferase (GGCT)/AIG2-like uncharacterized protein YtfP